MAQVFDVAKYRKLPQVEPQTFSHEADRTRLSQTALVAFRSLVKYWSLTGNEAAALMAVSPSTWDRMKRDDFSQPLNQDQLTRVSSMIGIFKGLRLLFADELADQWPRLPNKGQLFDGATPIASMIEGGIPRMLDIRRHVDALRGGL